MGPPSTTRRRLLTGAGTMLGVALAGCGAFQGPQYSLESRPEAGADPVELFTWRPASNAFHYHDDRPYVEALADELRETGAVDSVEIPLVEARGTGEAGYVPSYTHHGGTYYRVRVTPEPATLERWTVWMEPLDELPEGVDYTTTPMAGLPDRDAKIVERASREAVLSVLEDRDHEGQRAYRRGVVFFEPLDPEASELVPDPPFEYARIEPDNEFGPDELAVRLHVGREAVETTRYTHELEPIATNTDEFVTHLETEHVAAQFSGADLSEDVAQILAQSTEIVGYDERKPLSEPYDRLLAALDLADVSLPVGRAVASWLRYYAYDGNYYATRLRLSDHSIV